MDLDTRQTIAVKIRIQMRRKAEQQKLQFKDEDGNIVKKYDHLEPKVDRIFPLLDPDLYWSDALAKH